MGNLAQAIEIEYEAEFHVETPNWIPHTPTPRQQLWLDLTCQEALYGGAAGGGKTDAILMAHLAYAEVPGYSGLILMRSFSDLSKPKAAMDRASEWLRGTAARWNEQKKQWRFPSGAVISFGYLETKSDRYNYRTAEYQQITPDEVTRFTLDDYTFLFSRLRRLTTSDVPIKMRPTCNPPEPGEPGYLWVKKRFIPQGWKPEWADDIKTWWIEDKDARGRLIRRAFVPSRLEDNPHIDQESYEESLSALDVVRYEQIRKGDWEVQRKGNIYKDWSDGVNGHHVITWSQFGEVFKQKRIPAHWRGNMGQDWGFSPDPCANVWNFAAAENSPAPYGVSLADDIFVPAILTCEGMIPDEVGDAIKEIENRSNWSARMEGRFLSHEANDQEAAYVKHNGLYFQRWKPGSTLGISRVQHKQRITHRDLPHPFKPHLKGRPHYYLIVPDDQLESMMAAEDDPNNDRGLGLLRAEFAAYRYVEQVISEQRGSNAIIPYDFFNHYMDAQRGIAQMCFPDPEPLTEFERAEARARADIADWQQQQRDQGAHHLADAVQPVIDQGVAEDSRWYQRALENVRSAETDEVWQVLDRLA